jgi:hypothetical protein
MVHSLPHDVMLCTGLRTVLKIGSLPCPLMPTAAAAGYDKVMHVWQLNAQGFQLVGHPGAWVVHRPHSPSAGYLKAFTGPRYTAQHQVHLLRNLDILKCPAAVS